jgi:hypothetical protein
VRGGEEKKSRWPNIDGLRQQGQKVTTQRDIFSFFLFYFPLFYRFSIYPQGLPSLPEGIVLVCGTKKKEKQVGNKWDKFGDARDLEIPPGGNPFWCMVQIYPTYFPLASLSFYFIFLSSIASLYTPRGPPPCQRGERRRGKKKVGGLILMA